MGRKVSIQKGFVIGVAAVAIVAILTGVIMRLSSISASSTTGTNADAISGCYNGAVNNCFETMNLVCSRTARYATKTPAAPTAAELAKYGSKVKVWNIGINNNDPNAKFRLVVAVSRINANVTPVRVSFALTPLKKDWGGNGDSIYLIFGSGLTGEGYKKIYNKIALNATYDSYVNVSKSSGDISILFKGVDEDGCLTSVANLINDLIIPSSTPMSSKTATVKPSVSPTKTPSAIPTKAPSVVSTPSLVPAASVDPNTLRQGAKIEFFNNITLTKAIYAKKINNIYLFWRLLSPAPSVNKDNFSDRITSKILAPATGEYYIGLAHNDGARVWLGGRKIMDDWHDWVPCERSCDNDAKIKRTAVKVYMEKGKLYDLKVEHYDKTEDALLMLYWKLPNSNAGGVAIPSSAYFTTYDQNPPHGQGTGLLGTYFNWNNLDQYKFWRKDAIVYFNWGANGPSSDMNKDNFSVRWTGKVRPRFTENYTFLVRSKDGAKLWINNELVIDKWQDYDVATANSSKEISLVGGKLYPIKLEYYNSAGSAAIELKWLSPSTVQERIPTGDLYYPGAPIISPGSSVTPSATASITASVSPSATPAPLTMTIKPGWNAISIPSTSKPVLTRPLQIDPYNFLTFAFDGTTTQNGKIVRTWNSNPAAFYTKMGYYLKNPGSQDRNVTFENSSAANSAVLHKGWNLIANSSDSAASLSSMTYSKRTCELTTDNPITCQAVPKTISLNDLSYGRPGEGKNAYTKVYYVAKPNADSNTPDPFTIYDVAREGGPANIVIPARGVFWLYLFY